MLKILTKMDDFRRVRLSEGYSDVTFVCQGRIGVTIEFGIRAALS
jgi:hypothetical protein